MNTQDPPIDYTAYWAAALERHKALIAAGCIPLVGVTRVSAGPKPADGEQEQE